ncbi:MAG: TonB-dependent receptor [Candidatus Binatia bacterium]|nr:TonB-dependent receptor [Candidatus Binatia bacterium]
MRTRIALAPTRSWIWWFVMVTILFVASASSASAEPTGGPEAPAEYQRGVDGQDGPSGTTDEIDAAEAQAQQAAEGRASGLSRRTAAHVEEIVVSARKRQEALEDTPVAVTALGAEALRESSVQRIDQVGELVPNLNVSTERQGNIALFSIRGVGTGSADIQFDPGVALYLDGVFFPRAPGSLLNIVDVQQMEVLRGPQGTLFGKNSVGGAINITTVKPQPEMQGFAMLRPGNWNGFDSQIMLNVPIVEDVLLSRVAFFTSRRDGYVYNTFRDEYASDANELAFLGSLRLLATDELTFDVSGTWSRSSTKGLGGQCIVVREDGPVAPLTPQLFPACRETTLFTWSSDSAGISDIESAGTWGVMNYDIGDAWVLEDLAVKALGSWQHQTTRLRFDVDGTYPHQAVLSTAGGSFLDGAPGPAEQTQGELQINGGALDGRLVFVTGFFAQWENAEDNRTTSVGSPLETASTTANGNIKNWTWAPYLQATGELTEWLSLTAGVRYTEDHKELTLTQTQPFTGDILFPTTTGAKLFTKWTPMASLASTLPVDLLPAWADHFMGYFTYSEGFKGGGFNALPGAQGSAEDASLAAPFGPETLDSYEVGFKTILFESRLSFNAAFFYAIYDDIQKISIQTEGTGDQIAVQRITENAAKATTKGFELEMMALPIDGLRITGNIGVTDATYDEFANAISDFDNELIDRSGEGFNNVPEFTSFLAIQYSLPIEGDAQILQGWLTPRLEWYYQSEVHLNGPEIGASVQHGYNRLNARLSYDFWDDRAQVALWGKNLADEEYIVFSTPTVSTFGTVVNYTGLPRTWGAEIAYRF